MSRAFEMDTATKSTNFFEPKHDSEKCEARGFLAFHFEFLERCPIRLHQICNVCSTTRDDHLRGPTALGN
jgi:hypothetical protein